MNTADLDIGREALVSLVAKMTMSLFGFVGVVVFAYVLGPTGVGRYYFPLAISLTLVRVSAGIGEAVKKRVSEVGTEPEEYLGLGLAFHGLFTIPVALAMFGAHTMLDFYPNAPEIIAGVFGVFVSVGMFQILNRFYQGIGHPGASYWVDTVRSVLTTTLQFVFLFSGLAAFGLLMGLTTASLISVGIVAYLAKTRPRLPGEETVASVKAFATWSVPSAIVQDFYKRLDVILLGVLVGESAVGFYETALRLVLPAVQLAGSVSTPLNVKASGRSSIGMGVREDISNVFTYTGLFAVPMFFGAAALPSALMRTFFSDAFAPAGTALVGIALFTVFNVYQTPLQAAIQGTDHPRWVFRVKVGGLLVHAPLAVFLTYEYGLMGVIAATLAAEFLMVAAYQAICRDLFAGAILPKPVVAQVAAGAGMFAVLSVAKDAVPLQSRLWVVLLVLFGAATYFAVLLAASAHFRLTVRNVLGPVYARFLATNE